ARRARTKDTPDLRQGLRRSGLPIRASGSLWDRALSSSGKFFDAAGEPGHSGAPVANRLDWAVFAGGSRAHPNEAAARTTDTLSDSAAERKRRHSVTSRISAILDVPLACPLRASSR